MTPRVVDEKAPVTIHFRGQKMKEYGALEHEIQQVKCEVADNYLESYDSKI
jgi:hypothetical protein